MSKFPLGSIWNEVAGWASQNASHYLYVPIPASRTDVHYDDTPLKPYRSYFRLWLSEMFLTKNRRWFKEWCPAVHACVTLSYGDQGAASFDKVAGLPEELQSKGVVLNYKLSELMPYNGGTVEITAGLLALAMKEKNAVGTAIKICGDFASLVAPPLGPALAVSRKVASGIKELMAAADGQVHLSVHQTLTSEGGGGAQALRPGYLAVILATADQLAVERLFVKQDRLYYSTQRGGEPKSLEGHDYMLLRIEGRDERDDWRLKNIQEPVEKAILASLKGNHDEAGAYTLIALATTYQSHDLAVHDKRRVAQAIKEELGEIISAGRGIQGGEETDLNQIMAKRATNVKLAMRLPPISFDEAIIMGKNIPGLNPEDEPTLPDSFTVIASDEPPSVRHLRINPQGEGSSAGRGAGSSDKGPTEENRRAKPLEGESSAEAAPATQDRRINAWVAERESEPLRPLVLKQTYTLNLSVGQRVSASLLTSDAANVPDADVPAEGLETKWVISSSTVEMASTAANDTSVTINQLEGKGWTAQFSLRIRKGGESELRQLRITPQTIEHAELQILIFVREALYRQFTVALNVAVSDAAPPLTQEKAAGIQAQVIHAPAEHSGLTPPHEWQTPHGRLTLAVCGQGKVFVIGRTANGEVLTSEDWNGAPSSLAGPIKNVRDSAEALRAAFSDQLNDIDPQDMQQRLHALTQDQGKFWLEDNADAAHQHIWEQQIAPSQQLFELAYYGYTLYQTLFPDNSKLRAWLDSLTPGWRIDLSWSQKTDAAWMPNFPWGLLYVKPPVVGQPVDPMNFWGLRFRVNYGAYAIDEPKSSALGMPDQVGSAYGLYWGNQPGDKEIADEATWQQAEWSHESNQTFIPDPTLSISPKDQLIQLLNQPGQKPTPLLYLFCQCDVGDGNKPILRFGSTKQPADNLKQVDLGLTPFKDHTVVFVNACNSVGSDPYIANELEQVFFRRGCRAYLGTEVKVPIRLASRFAFVFYRFFYRDVDPLPMAAGEAVYQTRRFLWRDYRNIGGLFYSYINQYDLYMATEAEVEALAH